LSDEITAFALISPLFRLTLRLFVRRIPLCVRLAAPGAPKNRPRTALGNEVAGVAATPRTKGTGDE
jgi:hypothetical protein